VGVYFGFLDVIPIWFRFGRRFDDVSLSLFVSYIVVQSTALSHSSSANTKPSDFQIGTFFSKLVLQLSDKHRSARLTYFPSQFPIYLLRVLLVTHSLTINADYRRSRSFDVGSNVDRTLPNWTVRTASWWAQILPTRLETRDWLQPFSSCVGSTKDNKESLERYRNSRSLFAPLRSPSGN